jgi:hypothetical protein
VGKHEKMTPEEDAAFLKRLGEFRDLLERRKTLDEKLRTERERRSIAARRLARFG